MTPEFNGIERRLDELSERLDRLRPLQEKNMADFAADAYSVSLAGVFDVVCYWDGFGIGSDEDPRRLSERIAAWLGPAGKALIEIGTPWYAAPFDGCGWAVGEAERQYSFDADGCRWEDRWRLKGRPEEAVKQSTRCYSPADLRLLAAGTGLAVTPCQAGRRHGLGRAKVAARCAAQAVDEIRCPVVSCEVAE